MWLGGLSPVFVPTDRTSSHSSVLMRKCWREDPEERPTFSQLSSIVERLLTSISGYTELGMVLLNTIQEVEQLSKCIQLFDTFTHSFYCRRRQ